jgi:uracil-DNA glycosylase
VATVRLRSLLRDQFAGWQTDLPPSWQAALEDVELDFGSRARDGMASRSEIIIPGRKRTLPPPEVPRLAHIFHAFDGITPERVRAVILGQDPYPKPSWLTGRAFEQGNLLEWPEKPQLIAASLRRIIQVLANARNGGKAYVRGDAGWRHVMRDLKDGKLNLKSPSQLFDHLGHQGVLLLNTSLTIGVERSGAKPRAPRGHFPLWRPFIQRVLLCVASRKDQYAVFLLWG